MILILFLLNSINIYILSSKIVPQQKQMHPFTYLFITIEQLLWLKIRKHITCIIIQYLEKYCSEFVSCHAIMEIICNAINNLGLLLGYFYSCNTTSPHRHFTLYWSHAQVFLFVLFSVFCISFSHSIWYSI